MVRKISRVSRRKLLRTYVYNVMRSCVKCDISGPDLLSPVARSYAENFSRSARNKRVARARKWGGLIRFPLEFMWRARAHDGGKAAREWPLSFSFPLYDLTACLLRSSGPPRSTGVHLDTTPSAILSFQDRWKGWAGRREARYFPDGKREIEIKASDRVNSSERTILNSLSLFLFLLFAFM